MQQSQLRKVGGSVMLAVPPAVLKELELRPGSAVGLTVTKEGALLVRPRTKPRHSLKDLLAESKKAGSAKDHSWSNGSAVGREIL